MGNSKVSIGLRFVVAVLAITILSFVSVLSVGAQDACPAGMNPATINQPPQGFEVWGVRNPANVQEYLEVELKQGDAVCVGPALPTDASFSTVSFKSGTKNVVGYIKSEAFTLYSVPQPTPTLEASAEATVSPVAQVAASVPAPDFSWMLATPEWVKLTAAANVRNAPDEASVLLGSVNPTTDGVVQVLARFSGRSLIRSANLFGWVNDANAFSGGAQAGQQPSWFGQNRGQGVTETCVQIVERVVVYAPAGDVLTDLTLFGADDSVIGHGTEVRDLDDHYIVVLRENGTYNPLMTRNGVWQRAEGDAWVCEGGTPSLKRTDAAYTEPWLMMEPATSLPGKEKASIGLEFGIKDAFVHSQIPFDPGVYHFVELDGTTLSFTQAEVLAFPQVGTVQPNAVGQGGGGAVVPPLAQANCTLNGPTEIVVQGEIEKGNLYKAAIGTPEQSCYNFAVYVDEDTPTGELEATAWQGQIQNFTYLRDNIVVVQFPSGTDNATMRAWVEANIVGIIQRMHWTDRKVVTFSNVPGYKANEKVTLSK